VCSMIEKNKFHIIIINTKTKEQKLFSSEHHTFSEAASKGYLESRKLWEKTGDAWDIVSIYNVNYNFDIAVQLT